MLNLSDEHSIKNKTIQMRAEFRKLRKSLTKSQQQQAAQAIIAPIIKLISELGAQKIALYLAFDGELETMPLIEKLWQLNYQVFLPIIQANKKMIFMPFTKDTKIKLNKYKIREPEFIDEFSNKSTQELSEKEQKSVAVDLDLILTPLVAFDDNNNRIGMGGGFYDRLLHNWHKQNFKPVGICHKIQKAPKIVPNEWDVALFKIIAV